MHITLTVNNHRHTLTIEGHETLLEVLREKLHLTGTKTACDEAECGACTVLINGVSTLSCVTLAGEVDGATIMTIEGLADGDTLHPIQEAFLEKGAVQCGFCTPGMIMATKALLDKNPRPARAEIVAALDGNICRCAGYTKIFEAVEDAATRLEKNT